MELLTAIEAATFLRLSAGTLEVWRARKNHPELRYYKLGGKIVYSKADLIRWVESRTVGGDAPAAASARGRHSTGRHHNGSATAVRKARR